VADQRGFYPVSKTGRRTGATKRAHQRLTDLRNRISVEFMSDLLDNYHENGKATIETLRITDPVNYCRLVATMVPRKLDVAVNQRKTVEIRALAEVREFLVAATRLGPDTVPELPPLPGAIVHVFPAAVSDGPEGCRAPVDLGTV
jgi:hypothetical protein